ncbi:MAG: bifunctional glutamate N-acetyltransferase/amino-acid acetyltransferase ArgJ [Chitinivibrionales bacterium]|nr:bifunctional glutamate N-acetyltransferase/amino-acid acetyltransferase ArgJ [Chitinivibrionales bacterium]MBD3395196.1 bifunctional glutamate N-acetyltransferase/amino-acid acetyltransferase ArgJ [Chitinivibrionales bacterium]
MKFSGVTGGITAARGFDAHGVAAGIKESGLPDVGLVFSANPCAAAGTFTTNQVRAACVDWNISLLPSKAIRALCCNSGVANACTGARGARDARATARKVSRTCGVAPETVLVASTGVIGEFLPMEKLREGIASCASRLSQKGGTRFARAIMTTDTVPKEYAIKVPFSGGTAVIGGCAKGAGMICPNMATMLCFITTDARIGPVALERTLRRVVGWTFNNLTVDGDMSTNDMVLALANGASGAAVRTKRDGEAFEDALFDVCNRLCAKIAGDGEGATKRIEVAVTGGKTYDDCKAAAKAIANSNLVKTAAFGCDPNWGRILAAIGSSGARFSQKRISVSLCGMPVYASLRPAAFDTARMRKALAKKIVTIDVDLGLHGKTCAVAHTCDLTYDYVKINAEYHT